VPSPSGCLIHRREIAKVMVSLVLSRNPWWGMPHDGQNCSAGHEYFQKQRASRVLHQIMASPRQAARRVTGREPSAGLVVDSPCAKSTKRAGPCGCDGSKEILGRERHIVIDREACPVVFGITPANTRLAVSSPVGSGGQRHRCSARGVGGRFRVCWSPATAGSQRQRDGA
jgi:hypothetical protein